MTLGNTDKIAISSGSCQQLTAKNKGVRIVEVGHAERKATKRRKNFGITAAWKIRSLPKSDGRENALHNRQGGTAENNKQRG
jgi:hypothetical protein